MHGTRAVALDWRGLITGVTSLRLMEGRRAVVGPVASNALVQGEQVVTTPTPGVLDLGKLELEYEAEVEYPLPLDLDVGELVMRADSSIRAPSMFLRVNEAFMEGDSVLTTTARGPTLGDLLLPDAPFKAEMLGAGDNITADGVLFGQGGGHGGYGGSHVIFGSEEDPIKGGQAYGSYKTPRHPGSPGGGVGGGVGGSIMRVLVGLSLHLDGSLESMGADASAPNSGGGSGGSIWIETTTFAGHGVINATGGSGMDRGGGGAGGRIGVHVRWLREFAGIYEAFGGFGGAPSNASGNFPGEAGAGGTVYYTDSNDGLDQREPIVRDDQIVGFKDAHVALILDNDNRNHHLATAVTDEENGYFEFDELHLFHHVTVLFHNLTSTIISHKFVGDRTGRVHVRGMQQMFVEVVEGVATESIAPVSYRIDPTAEVIFPTRNTFLGTRTLAEGLVTNIEDFRAAEGALVVFTNTSRTAMLEGSPLNKTYLWMTTPGNLTFGTMTMQRGCVLDLDNIPDPLTLQASSLLIKYQSLVLMNRGYIETSYGVVEGGGILNLNYTGHPEMTGPGAGMNHTDERGRPRGAGAGYGGQGGGFHVVKPRYESVPGFPGLRGKYIEGVGSGGLAYGSVVQPIELGSGGGAGAAGSRGGSGGGFLVWRSELQLHVDGFIHLFGQDGQGKNAGGGSGGSFFAETLNMTGHGTIDVSGGRGVELGGGGSGGRIGIHCHFAHKFGGHYRAAPGEGDTYGTAGSVYREETNRGPQYADIKYSKEGDVIAIEPGFIYVKFDAEDHLVPWYSLMIEGNSTVFEFDELELTRHANLELFHPSHLENITAVVHEFVGDNTGRLHLRSDQQLYVDYVANEPGESTAPASYWIDEGAEIILPSTVYLRGTRSVFEGQLTGVIDLYLFYGSVSQFSSTANTAFLENGTYSLVTSPGNFTFGTVTVRRASEIEFLRVTTELNLNVADLTIKYGGTVLMNHADIFSSTAYIEATGRLSLDARGPGGLEVYMGPSPGVTVNDIGSGGGHGGEGGGNHTFMDNGVPIHLSPKGGEPHGSMYRPTQLGSGGGHGKGGRLVSPGGRGGGQLFWDSAVSIEVDGTLSCRGGNGTGENSGGGSGGSILIQTTNFTGHGELAVNGGHGTKRGYDGAGGRVAVHCEWRYKFGGRLRDRGGNRLEPEPLTEDPVRTQTVRIDRAHSYGGGYNHETDMYWFPHWPGSLIYTYDRDFEYRGVVSAGSKTHIAQIWTDFDGSWYAVSDINSQLDSTVTKFAPLPERKYFEPPHEPQVVWEVRLGPSTAAVASDEYYVYAMRRGSNTVYELYKDNGETARTFALDNVPGLSWNNLHGGLAVGQEKLFYASGSQVYRFNLKDGSYDDYSFTVGSNVDGLNFDGQDMCVHSNGDSRDIRCYAVFDENVYDDVHPERISRHLNYTLNPFGAAAGTIFVAENRAPPSYKKLKYDPVTGEEYEEVNRLYAHVDNEGFNVPGATVILEDNTTYYEFDELELTGYSRMLAYHPQGEPVTVVVHRFIGDKTGQFHVRNDQLILVEYVESTTNHTEAPCSFRGDAGSEIIFPSETHLHGVRSVFEGLITNVEDMYIEDGATLQFASSSQTASLIGNLTRIYMTQPGNITFGTLTIKYGGTLELQRIKSHAFTLTVAHLHVQFNGNMFANEATILSATGNIESEGVLHLDATGHPAETGPCRGSTVDGYGSGAAHGGQGGGLHAEHATQACDSVYAPDDWGSGGGNGLGTGGSGGGFLVWEVESHLELNGRLSARGGNGQGLRSGGGAGGSVQIRTYNMSGHGTIDVHGGAGGVDGFGGAGGRAAVLCELRYRFGGAYLDYGGIDEHPAFTTSAALTQRTLDPRSYGTGFNMHLNEYWFPKWPEPFAWRVDADTFELRGTVELGTDNVMQLWFDDDNYYYTADHTGNKIGKYGPYPDNDLIWEVDMQYEEFGQYASGVAVSGREVFVMRSRSEVIYVYDVIDGAMLRTFALEGGRSTYNNADLYGGFAIVHDKIFYGSGTLITRHDLATGQYDGFSFSTAVTIRSMVFNGEELCVSDNTAKLWCYQVLVSNTFKHPQRGGPVNMRGAAAGTTYVEENLRPLEYRIVRYSYSLKETVLTADHTYLHVDNIGVNVPWASVISEEGTDTYEFDEVELTGHSRLIAYHPGTQVNVTIHKFIGDRTGQLHVQDQQIVFVEYVESLSNKTEAPCSFKVDVGGEIVFPVEVYLLGVRSVFEGMLTGIEQLHVGDGAYVEFSSSANTAQLENEEYVDVTTPGNFSIPIIMIKRNSEVEFSRIEHNLTISATDIFIRYGGLMMMNEGKIDTTLFSIEYGGALAAGGRGFAAQTGPGSGFYDGSNGRGLGASYGGYGGGHNIDNTAHTPYGTVYEPLLHGSGGGIASGATPTETVCYSNNAAAIISVPCMRGSGGGVVHLNAGSQAEMDGVLIANGAEGVVSNGGGGSGGSIFIETTNFTGQGEVNVNGGAGHGSGFGGSGGRIAVHIRHRHTFGGALRSVGGLPQGGPGTVYAYEINRGPQYALFKYNPELKKIAPVSPHRHVRIDQENNVVPQPALIMDTTGDFIDFDEMTVDGYAKLYFYHPDDQEHVTIVGHEVRGDRTGIIRVRSNQRFFVEVVVAAENVHDAPVTYYVDEDAELLMPPNLILRGEDLILEGRLTNVEHLYVESGGEFVCDGQCHTALLTLEKSNDTVVIHGIEYEVVETSKSFYPEDAYRSLQDPHSMKFSTVEVKNTATLNIKVPNADVEVADFDIRFGGLVRSNTQVLTLNIGESFFEHTGRLVADGSGYGANTGPGASSDTGDRGCGGAYANVGGRGDYCSSLGSVYGSVFMNSGRMPGSGGGGPNAGAGGGLINLLVGGRLQVDGMISSNGGNGGSYSGGGSGGGIYVNTERLTGHGVIQANGGNGGAYSGGGSGGRVVVHITAHEFRWDGAVTAFGGRCGGASTDNGGCHTDTEHGGVGSVYVRSHPDDGDAFHTLILDNRGRNRNTYPFVLDEGQVTFDHLHMVNNARLQFSTKTTPSAPAFFKSVTGDLTGLLYVQSGREVHIGGRELEASYPAVDMTVDTDGQLEGTLRFFVRDTFNVHGMLSGVQSLYLLPGTRMNINGGRTTCLEGTCSAAERSWMDNNYMFKDLVLYKGASIVDTNSNGNTKSLERVKDITVLHADRLHMQYSSSVTASTIAIWTRQAKVDQRASLSTNARGYTIRTGPTTPSGSSCRDSVAGSYGGRGGRGKHGNSYCGVEAGDPYGHACYPYHAGGGAGSN
ncbi:hypothetical protein PTSG_13036 [Salpingoeca rosetta]|uniref:Uncharacterized protein n=1 Tax=Salpingoeca rosetta (strain ATCC 50818 / BSB-021) TaxID=946362 RepID=F2UR73_SALR5|nr:uncharacterized protein PTSG_13036 [Salpingoeca rosetta]EGD80128.1 hypothetical protein PTSG_13036 [Salpingoeca rosetta]|eukprot:XP_004988453.1 hypothetical protein PTSG_13036 [Salpingoeca rosetta]